MEQMVRGGNISRNPKQRNGVRPKNKGSDDSDEDYVISDEENEVSDDSDGDFCSSIDGNASDFDNFVEEEEREVKKAKKVGKSKAKRPSDRFVVEEKWEDEDEEEMEEVRKAVRPKVKRGLQRNGVKPSQKRRRVKYEEEDDEEEDGGDEFLPRNGFKPSQKRGRVKYKEEEDGDDEYRPDGDDEFRPDEDDEYRPDGDDEFRPDEDDEFRPDGDDEFRPDGDDEFRPDGDDEFRPDEDDEFRPDGDDEFRPDGDDEFRPDDEDDDDEEFTPDDDDCSDEEELRVKRKKSNVKASKQALRKKGGPSKGQKRRRKVRAPKKPLRKRLRKTRTIRRKLSDDDDDDCDFIANGLALRERSEVKKGRKRRRSVAPSDSDLASSGSSDYDFTISEEEREQVREAKEFCEPLKKNLRSSSVPLTIVEDVTKLQQRKPCGRKGKEKVEEVKAEIVKQVCGICLTEEDKRRVRGTLNCCTHYFCFTCIMEWAKVESRCPLCKQRFMTISKPARSTAGIDLREVLIQVPERDQVYQPSEEELRSYLDPYENVICTECHEGGDDGLMLLCDQCDSPAHTFCVGLGREVPEGNWYCDGCRPVALGSSSSLAQTRLSDQRTATNNLSNRTSPGTNFMDEGFDLNSVSSQGFGGLSSPRYHAGNMQASSPFPGSGAPTLSGRRLIHRHIQQLLSFNRMTYMADRAEGNSAVNLGNDILNSPVDQARETTLPHANRQESGVPFHAFFQETLRENPSPAVQDNNFLSPRLSQSRRQMGPDPSSVAADRPLNGTLWPGLAGRNSLSGYEQQQLHQCSRPFAESDREESDFSIAKEQLQSMIRSHLKNLSRDNNLSQTTSGDITSSSINTVLAACGLEHISSEVVDVPPPSICSHIELMAGGKTSLMRGCCSSCFDSFVVNVVKKILEVKLLELDTKIPDRTDRWLSLGL
ncbi:hypothetical protein UlMin_029104 [Ulmus minor]